MKIQLLSSFIFVAYFTMWPHYATAGDDSQAKGILPASTLKENATSTVNDSLLHQARDHFQKQPSLKPSLPVANLSDNGSDSTDRVQTLVTARPLPERQPTPMPTSVTNTRDGLLSSKPLACSPRYYQHTLKNGNCSRVVFTQVCHTQRQN